MSAAGKEAVRLCEHVVRQSFGDVVGRVASTLLNRGRLTVRTLAGLSHTSIQAIQASLLVLIQHHLVQYSDPNESPERVLYEFRVEECLLRLRWGRLLAITEQRLGPVAVEVVKQVMLFGMIKAGDVQQACGSDGAARANDIQEAAIGLVKSRFLESTWPSLQVCEADEVTRRFALLRKARILEKGGIQFFSDTDRSNCLERAKWEIEEEREDLRHMNKVLVKGEKTNKKKKGKGKSEEDHVYSLRSDVHLRLRYDRYHVLIRNEIIANAATEKWNAGAGQIMRVLLESAIDQDTSIQDKRTQKQVGVDDILDQMPPKEWEMLAAGLYGSLSGKSNMAQITREYFSILAGEDQILQPGRDAPWLSGQGDKDKTYVVALENVANKVRAGMVRELVRERLGERAARVLAIVAAAKRVGEQQVRDIGMMPMKEARVALAQLAQLSLIEAVEVPRSLLAKSRSSSGGPPDHFLWSIDTPRVYSYLLASTYKTIGNLLQRKEKELALRKLSRAKEDKAIQVSRGQDLGTDGARAMLNSHDQESLAELDDTMLKLTLSEMREEMVVFLLRDLPGVPGLRV